MLETALPCARVIPIVAVQVAPPEAPAALEQRMLEACSSGLRGTRCVRARSEDSSDPRAIAVVSWVGQSEVNIEVGLGREQPPVWRARNLAFEAGDPEAERWRAIGFTIALLVGDDGVEPAAALALPEDAAPAAGADAALPLALEARAVAGAGLVSAAWRWGGEVRLSLLLSDSFFATSSVQYALASDEPEIDVRWLDASAGVGLWSAELLDDVEGRARFELLLENLAVTAQQNGVRERQSVWIPGILVGVDVGFRFAPHWVASARLDAFGLDGSTSVTSEGERVAASAGAGLFLGAGMGYRF